MCLKSERIKKVRIMNKLSQKEFADSLHVSHTLISKLEHGKSPITDRLMQQISSLYNIDIEWLKGESDILNSLNEDTNSINSDSAIKKKALTLRINKLIDWTNNLSELDQELYLDFLSDLLSIGEDISYIYDMIKASNKNTIKITELVESSGRKYNNLLKNYLTLLLKK